MNRPRYPSLYQINTRVWLTELSRNLGRPATLDDVPDAELDRLAEAGFDWIWFLSVWQTGPGAQQVSRSNPGWRREFQETLPDLRDEDIAGSGFAITGYTVHENLGGDAALARLRERLRKRGLRVMLDFVPNHVGLDHPWLVDHPEYFVGGSELDLARAPQNYTWVKRRGGDLLLAYGHAYSAHPMRTISHFMASRAALRMPRPYVKQGIGLGASDQTEWTGVVARIRHLFSILSRESVLKGGRRIYFERFSTDFVPTELAEHA
jgi:hypothetical protein